MSEDASASRVLLCGPAGSGKTERVLHDYVQTVSEHGEDAALLLFPTRLACERARGRLISEQMLPGLLDPRILTFDDLADLLLHANHQQVSALGELPQRMLMQQIVRDLCNSGRLRTLAPMCEFPGFIASLCNLVQELKHAGVDPRQFAARLQGTSVQNERSGDLSLIYESYQRRLQDLNLYDGAGRFWYARQVLQEGRRRPFEELRMIAVNGFDDFTTTQLEVLDLLAADADITITLCRQRDESARPELFTRPRRTSERIAEILGKIRTAWADGDAGGAIAAMGQRIFVEGEVEPLPESDGVELIEATGRRMEVRQVLGRVKLLLLEGVDPERIAIIARTCSGYSRALSEVAGELGVPVRPRSAEPVGSRPSVQAILDLVRTPAEALRSRDVMRLLKSGYLDRSLLGDTELDPDEIERVCAEARIIGGRAGEDGRGVAHWRERLGALAARLRRSQSAEEREDDEDQQWSRRSAEELTEEIELVERVQEALTRLFEAFEPLHCATTLAGFVDALADLIERFGIRANIIGGDATVATASNLAALGSFFDGLRELWSVQQVLGIEAETTLAEFHEEIVRMAQGCSFVPPGPAGGVIAIDAGQARQLEFDHVFLLGMTEREFPRAAREDALFDDRQRAELSGVGIDLAQRHDSVYEDAFLFYVIAVSARQRLTLSYPAVDAEGRSALRSWYVDEVSRCFTGGLEPRSYGLTEMVPRIAAALSRRELLQAALFEAFGTDTLLRSRDHALAKSSLTALAPEDSELLDALADLIALEDGRNGFEAPDRYDGNLFGTAAGVEIGRLLGPEKPLSASALGSYARCPFAFFSERVLRLVSVQEPSEDIDPAMIGGIVHRCLRDFFVRWQEVREDRRIELEDLERAAEVIDEVVDRHFEDELRAGTVADEVVFELKREDVRRNLHLWLEYEVEKLQAAGHTAWRLEQRFGFGRTEPVVVGEGDRQVILRGQVDRVDLLESDSDAPAFAVYDYKTGNAPSFTGLQEGQDFQLPVYAMAAQQIMEDEGSVCAEWGYYSLRRPIRLSRCSDPEEIAALITESCERAQEHAEGIRSGVFVPLSPGRCGRCDFGSICRWDEYRFRRKLGGEYAD